MEFQLLLMILTTQWVKHEYALETTTVLPNQRFDAVVLGTCGILDLDFFAK
jgi:hypothetical protein